MNRKDHLDLKLLILAFLSDHRLLKRDNTTNMHRLTSRLYIPVYFIYISLMTLFAFSVVSTQSSSIERDDVCITSLMPYMTCFLNYSALFISAILMLFLSKLAIFVFILLIC